MLFQENEEKQDGESQYKECSGVGSFSEHLWFGSEYLYLSIQVKYVPSNSYHWLFESYYG